MDAAATAYREERLAWRSVTGGGFMDSSGDGIAVNDGISGVYEKVHVQDTAVTLTSRDGKIQVTTTNTSDVPLTVRVRLSSPEVDRRTFLAGSPIG